MNISTTSHHIPIQTAVNPQTDSLRRENHQREIITKPEPSAQSAAEKGVASDKERGRTPAQNNEHVDFANLRKLADQESNVIGDSSSSSNGEETEGRENSQKNQNDEESSEVVNQEEQVEQKQIVELKLRDQEVRTHEQAHASVGGSHTGAPTYTFEVGPDGKQYAVAGEVSVDLSPVSGDPKETIAKMKQVHAAALAPAEPSPQDIKVAASATKMILEAQSELLAMQSSEDGEIESRADLYRSKDVFQREGVDDKDSEDSQAFDQFINQTLASQENVAPSRSIEVDQRAGRIEQFYSSINNAYEKEPSFQFELTA